MHLLSAIPTVFQLISLPYLLYYACQKHNPKVIAALGIAASGKTTFFASIAEASKGDINKVDLSKQVKVTKDNTIIKQSSHSIGFKNAAVASPDFYRSKAGTFFANRVNELMMFLSIVRLKSLVLDSSFAVILKPGIGGRFDEIMTVGFTTFLYLLGYETNLVCLDVNADTAKTRVKRGFDKDPKEYAFYDADRIERDADLFKPRLSAFKKFPEAIICEYHPNTIGNTFDIDKKDIMRTHKSLILEVGRDCLLVGSALHYSSFLGFESPNLSYQATIIGLSLITINVAWKFAELQHHRNQNLKDQNDQKTK